MSHSEHLLVDKVVAMARQMDSFVFIGCEGGCIV